jgi:hypothetical protein
MPLRMLQADEGGRLAPIRFYWSCSTCGWCGPLRSSCKKAGDDGIDHWVAKSKAAER